MAESKLRSLSVDFAVQILNIVKALKSQHETIVSNQIGFAWNWHKAKEKFGNITFDGSVLSIGNDYSIPKEKYDKKLNNRKRK